MEQRSTGQIKKNNNWKKGVKPVQQTVILQQKKCDRTITNVHRVDKKKTANINEILASHLR